VKFLIVDDDPACRTLLKTVLEPYAECDLAFDGGEAIDAVRLALEDGKPYELICLDIMMPNTNGHEALQAIRDLEQRHGIGGTDAVKIIMATALMDSKHCVRAFKSGCESYVTKPLHVDELLDQVRALLGDKLRSPAPKSPRPAPACDSSTNRPVHDDTAESGTAAYTPPAGADHKPRYLVVDDDSVCRALLKSMLTPYGQCTFAYDGQEAVDAVRLALEDDAPFDLICLDIMMPGLNGHDALQKIREVEREFGRAGSDGTRVIMTTALRDPKHCVQSFREGCECYITKPIDEQELLEKMSALGLLESAGV